MNGNLRNGAVGRGIMQYSVYELEEKGGWGDGRLWPSDGTHRKLALAAEDLSLDDHAIEITGETHDDGSLTFRQR